MKLFNTLTKQVETITPLNPPKVTVYTCGPTVYDYPHVGNWFTFIRYDLLVRALRLNGYEPQWVMNITDVGHLVSDADEGEDKLEKGAHREGKTAWDVAKFYGDYFITGLSRLNITQPDMLPRATEHIQEQIALIQTLEDKGYTYVIDDGVYYDTSKFPKYADFAQLDLDEQQAGKRVSFNEQKRNPTDFALWKFSPKDHQRDMEWDSPWGKGFPGWHIECSAMSMKYLGETIDIHAGGIDHLPVHHTNEIAQSEGATGKQFAKYWMHTNHVLVDGEKISKSTGNGIVLEDIEAKGLSLAVFRFVVLQSHYTSQSKFSWEGLEAAKSRLQRWQEAADQRWQVIPTEAEGSDAIEHTKLAATALADFREAMENDLNTPQALSSIESIISAIEQVGMTSSLLGDFTKLLQQVDQALGINLLGDDISDDEKQLIATREEVRVKSDWAKSDELRDQLKTKGIGLRDTGNRTTWFRL